MTRSAITLGAIQPASQSLVEEQMKELERVCVPSFFTCPISFDMMKDPVTLSTGMTYDRSSIEQWLDDGHNTCPATNQVLPNQELIPNHTLRRLIQDWCVANKAYGVERIPTPKQPIQPEQVRRLLEGVSHRHLRYRSLKQLRSFAKESEKNRKHIVTAPQAVPILAATFNSLGLQLGNESGNVELLESFEDALGIIVLLNLNESEKLRLARPRSLASLCWLLSSGSLDAKVNAAELLESLAVVDSTLKTAVGSTPGAIQGLVNLLRENHYPRAVHASLKCLLSLCSPRSNRLITIEADAVAALVELLPNTERGNSERSLSLLEILASCAEGREAISKHALAIPVIVKCMVGISVIATEHAVGALWAVLSFSSNRGVLYSALQAGVVGKLLMLVQSDCSQRAKHKGRDVLKLLNEAWADCPCRPPRSSPGLPMHAVAIL